MSAATTSVIPFSPSVFPFIIKAARGNCKARLSFCFPPLSHRIARGKEAAIVQKKNKGALNLAGLVLFLLALPFFFGMGGGAFAMAEVLRDKLRLPSSLTQKRQNRFPQRFSVRRMWNFPKHLPSPRADARFLFPQRRWQGSGIFPTSEAAITSLTAVQLCFPRTLTQKKHWGLILA